MSGSRIKQQVKELEKEVHEYRRRAPEPDRNKEGAVSDNGSNAAIQDCLGSPGGDKGISTSFHQSSSTSTRRVQRNSDSSDASNMKAGSSSGKFVLNMAMTDEHVRPSDMGAMLQPGSSATETQFLTQLGHSRSQRVPQLAFAPFHGFASPPLSQSYSLSPDWGWSNVANSVYLENLNQQSLTGKEPPA